MKKLLIATLAFATLTAVAQKAAPKKSATKTAAIPLKNLTDSASYGIGLSVANFYKQQGFKNLNIACVSKAINDVQNGGKPQLDEAQANEAIMFYINPTLRQNIEAGKKFLTANKTKAGIKTTASGIQYEVLKDAQGPKPVATDTVVVNYAGTLINGTEFDNSAKSGKPIEFPLNRVIKGWTEALQLMPVGSKYKFYIPHNLAYGVNDNGAIPGGSTLIFEVELLQIKK
jgi:FKBP-type peptidyl-prolyl cis-trans isomerase FklB